jgi:hypothetical protein
MNTFQILTSKFWFDLMHWNVSICPEIWPIFGRFLTLFPLKRPARREKIPPTWRRPSVTSWMTSRASPLYRYQDHVSWAYVLTVTETPFYGLKLWYIMHHIIKGCLDCDFWCSVNVWLYIGIYYHRYFRIIQDEGLYLAIFRWMKLSPVIPKLCNYLPSPRGGAEHQQS